MQRGKKCGIIQKDHPETNVSRWFSGIEVTGLEPAASWSQTTRATNCATPRSYNLLIIIHKRRGRQALAQQKSSPVVFIFQVLGKGDGLLVGKKMFFPGENFLSASYFRFFRSATNRAFTLMGLEIWSFMPASNARCLSSSKALAVMAMMGTVDRASGKARMACAAW